MFAMDADASDATQRRVLYAAMSTDSRLYGAVAVLRWLAGERAGDITLWGPAGIRGV